MATAIGLSHDAAQVDRAFDCIMNATMHLYSTDKLITFAKIVFGDAKVGQALTDIREEHAGHAYSNGGSGTGMGYLALMRAYRVLQALGEDGNAAELKSVALGQTGEDILNGYLEQVDAGY